MIWIVLTGALVPLIWYKFIKSMRHWKDLGVNQTKPWPILGDLWKTIFRILSVAEYIEWIYNMYPNSRYVGIYEFTKPLLVLRDPELIKQITVKDFDHFTDRKRLIDPQSDPLWNGNLFALTGQRWREMRATLSSSFTSSKMKNMFHLMEKAAENFVQYFLSKNEDVIELEMKDIYTRYTNDVIATAAFGIQCDSLSEPKNEFYLMGKAITTFRGLITLVKVIGFSLAPKLFRLLGVRLFRKEPAIFFTNIIKETIKTREDKGIVRPDMINLLLEAKKGVKQNENEAIETGFATVKESSHTGNFKQIRNLTDDDITSQALIFFFAGFDTVASALCFGTYELVRNKDIQDRLREEIEKTRKKNNGKITYDILLKMNYLDMVISEMLRMWPPAAGMDRVCTKPYTIQPVTQEEKPIPMKVGDLIVLPIYAFHRDPVYYPNPDKFDPERFSDANKGSITPYTYLPFGSGPRNCIGSRFALLEMKALLFNLLLNFEIVPTQKTQIPLKLERKTSQNTAEGGYWYGLKRIRI